MDEPLPRSRATVVLPDTITACEARFLLEAFSRVKARRYGRLVVVVSDGRVVDVEVVEKVDRNALKTLAT